MPCIMYAYKFRNYNCQNAKLCHPGKEKKGRTLVSQPIWLRSIWAAYSALLFVYTYFVFTPPCGSSHSLPDSKTWIHPTIRSLIIVINSRLNSESLSGYFVFLGRRCLCLFPFHFSLGLFVILKNAFFFFCISKFNCGRPQCFWKKIKPTP